MSQAIVNGGAQISRRLRSFIHGLEEEMGELEALDLAWRQRLLRIHQLELVTGALDEWYAGFGAHADPVDCGRNGEGPVGLDGDLEAHFVQSLGQRLIDLQHGLSAGEHDIRQRAGIATPPLAAGSGETLRRSKLAAARAVGAPEIGIAELAGGLGAIRLAAGPEIA